MMHSRRFITQLIWILGFELIGMFIGRMTQAEIQNWTTHLQQSSLTPPNWVFPVVWSILYAFLALISEYLWRYRSLYQRSLNLMALQMILNWLWTPVFFLAHAINLSLAMLVIMMIITAWILQTLPSKPGYLRFMLIFYLAWLGFATYLTAYIWLAA